MTYSYFYTKGERHMSKKQKIWIIVLVIFGLYILTGIIVGLSNSNSDENVNKLPVGGYYLGETLNYKDIDITVTKVTCEMNYDEDSDYRGLYRLKVYFTYKNNRTKEFEVERSAITLKTEDKGEKYDVVGFSAYVGMNVFEALFHTEKVLAGAQKSYWVSFYTPYNYTDKRFIVEFDWGSLSATEEYHLYYRDGLNYGGITQQSQSKVTADKRALELQEQWKDYFRGSVYDKIVATMTYTNVESLARSAIKYINENTSENVFLVMDDSIGEYTTRFNVVVNLNNEKYYLLFVEVECTADNLVDYIYYGEYTI